MAISGPRFFLPTITGDHNWMIGEAVQGEIKQINTFVGSFDDVQAICNEWNRREQAAYKAASFSAALLDDRKLAEIAASLGIDFPEVEE